MSNVVITGANRGIGLALTKRYLDAGDQVLALCRSPDRADALQALAKESGGKLAIGAIDIADQASVDAAANLASDPVDILINNAGIIGGADQALDTIDVKDWLNAFDVMAIGPFRVTRAFVSRLEAAKGKALWISSQLAASVWPYGGLYGYASAKAAGNRVVQILAIDLEPKGIIVASIHPGYVQTDLGGPQAEITPGASAAGIHDLVSRLGPNDSGGFFKWNGEAHPL